MDWQIKIYRRNGEVNLETSTKTRTCIHFNDCSLLETAMKREVSTNFENNNLVCIPQTMPICKCDLG